MGKKAVAKEFGVAFEPGPMGPMVDAAVDRALSLAFGPGARPALAIFFHHALLALSVCLLIFVLSKLLSPRLFRKALSKLEPFERKIWHTNMVTFFPAFAVTYYAWPAIVAYDGAKYDFLHPASVDTLKGCGMSLGYMFWDLVVLLADPKDQMKAYGGLSPYVLFLFHHTLSLLAWPYAVSAGRCTYFVNYFLVSEVTNANLSLRWFLVKHRWRISSTESCGSRCSLRSGCALFLNWWTGTSTATGRNWARLKRTPRGFCYPCRSR